MAVFMSAALPAWRHAARREKEAELLWRGRQYDRAIQLFRRTHSVPGPPNVDVLVQQKFLRKKYKDPITGADFELRPVSAVGEISDSPEGGTRRTGSQAQAQAQARARERRERLQARQRRSRGQLIGGVRSKSKEKSILVLNGRDRYNEWEFTYTPYTDARKTPEEVTPGRQRQPRTGTNTRSRSSNRRGSSGSGSGSGSPSGQQIPREP
jgi:hypothetical protein